MAISNQDYVEMHNKAQRLSKAIKFDLTNVTNYDIIRIRYIIHEASRVHDNANRGSALCLPNGK